MKHKLGMDTIDLVEQAVEYRERMNLLTVERDEWKRKAERYKAMLEKDEYIFSIKTTDLDSEARNAVQKHFDELIEPSIKGAEE